MSITTAHMPAGVQQRIENGSLFVVLCGSAIVEFEDGESLVYLRRGSMCRFAPMSHTRWTIADDIELLPVTEAAVVFKEHGSHERMQGVEAGAARPFRPRRQVS